MNEVTRIINAIEQGDKGAAEKLLPLVYEELRILAAQKMAQEKPGQTLQATALVHEAYLRLLGSEDGGWDNRGHFFKAAAEAMRRILIEKARSKRTQRRGGEVERADLEVKDLPVETYLEVDDLIALDEALTRLAGEDAIIADVVKLHCFAGLALSRVAEILGVSPRTTERYWAFAKTWLFREMSGEEEQPQE
ncbi:MAG: sigma-70 family RNA polymerase sigma factor [Phycisphaerae bacterium]|nr:sigma-70 family RNA polymerase sigma factor [Phycisphaerae bacterium]NIU09114.1 sigma-70 family RNA polymerase sigma factor [Phycisphaerae bacterium]NIU58187.1 sigma-70 family RNA polymerase sigma factor [Phycisphaerae bacterium]